LHGYSDIDSTVWGHNFDILKSRDVIDHVTIRLATYGFL